jgi:hypothetical protein
MTDQLMEISILDNRVHVIARVDRAGLRELARRVEAIAAMLAEEEDAVLALAEKEPSDAD